MSGLFLKLIYHGAGMVVHHLLLKFSMSNLTSNNVPAFCKIRMPLCKQLARFLCEILAYEKWFPLQVDEDSVVFIGSIILRHITQLVCNASAIYQVISQAKLSFLCISALISIIGVMFQSISPIEQGEIRV